MSTTVQTTTAASAAVAAGTTPSSPSQLASATVSVVSSAAQSGHQSHASPQTIAIEITKLPSSAEPHWTAYWTAVATPLVAIIAATVAATIAYRQWRTAHQAVATARNKLKLELFDRRLVIYEAAAEMIDALHEGPGTKLSRHHDLETRLRGHQWLFERDIQDYLNELANRSKKNVFAKPVRTHADDEVTSLDFDKFIQLQSLRERDKEELNRHFAPYLKLEH
jgi:hypothetical protein